MSTIETNKLTQQKTAIDVAPEAKVMRAVVTKFPPRTKERETECHDSACAHHCLAPFFRNLSSLLMNFGIYFVFIAGITIPGITFLIPRLNNSISFPC